ncbi:MAG: hypothetical protein J0L87_10740 [Bacteroidetes bacterium]|nr:hypothetical protein [Bacteroidota bacterium]
MKKINTILLAVGLITVSNVKAQGLYVNTISSYGFSLAPMSISANYNNNGVVESVRSSFGKGLEFGGGFGFYFNKNIGAEINASYLLGGKTEFTDASSPNTPADVETLKGRMIRIIPAIKITTGEKFRPYTKLGFVLGAGCKLIDESVQYSYDWSGIVKTEETSEFSGGMSMGFKGNLGLDLSLSENLAVFGEVNFISQAWAPKKNVTTKFLVNSQDQLSTLPVHSTETEFVDSYNSNASYDPNQPAQSLKIYLPFSSWGVNVGIHYTFGKKKE